MWKLFNETNALKSENDEDLNQYFLKPVDKRVSTWTFTRCLDLDKELDVFSFDRDTEACF